ncbi:MAG: glycosyltransferase [Candidatus Omnitrophica bacterium]|nr:glycosyltransferase [Candidatus Omnitrophota bacterium]
MKILFGHLCRPGFGKGGAEQVVLNLATRMRDEYHHDVGCLINECSFKEELEQSGIPIYKIPWAKPKLPETLRAFKSVIRSFRPDLIHSHHRYLTFLADIFFKRDLKILHTEHVLRQDKRLLFRYGHYANGVHESVTRNLEEFYKVPKNRLETIPNAVFLPSIRENELKVIQEKYADFPRIRALCIGRLDTQKGHSYLVEAIAGLPESLKEKFCVFFAGDGPLEEMLREKVSQYQLEKHIIFLGFTRQISSWLRFCDFLILPSLWEGMPLSILEAYAAHKCVLATDIPGSRDMILENETGLLAPSKNSGALRKGLVRLLQDEQKILEMGESAFRHYEKKYSFQEMLKRYQMLYEEVIRLKP